MSSPKGTLRVHQNGPMVVFQVEGMATMHQSLPLREFAELALAGGCSVIRVDLRHCTYVDSTFMGTLLFLTRSANQKGAGFAIDSPAPPCQRIFRELMLDKFYPIVTEEELPVSAWTELRTELNTSNRFTTNVVQAHQELANLTGPAGDTFKRVVRCFEKDIEAHKG